MKAQVKIGPVQLSVEPARSQRSAGSRSEVIRRAKRRIASGFYDSEQCLDVVIDRLLNGLSRQENPLAGRNPNARPAKGPPALRGTGARQGRSFKR
jgi:hypothetical protein